jgi:hypothetical protein
VLCFDILLQVFISEDLRIGFNYQFITSLRAARPRAEFVSGGEKRAAGLRRLRAALQKMVARRECEFARDFLDWDAVLYRQRIPK